VISKKMLPSSLDDKIISHQCAIDVSTNTSVNPSDACKQNTYKCQDCNQHVILAAGQVISPYFRHSAQNACNRFTKESYIHLEAKQIVKNWLESGRSLKIIRTCKFCNYSCNWELPFNADTCIVSIEHEFFYNDRRRRADVAVVCKKSSEIIVIFEICNTSKTLGENRPEPWFEFDAKAVVDKYNKNSKTGDNMINSKSGDVINSKTGDNMINSKSGDVINSKTGDNIISLKCIRNQFADEPSYYNTCEICYKHDNGIKGYYKHCNGFKKKVNVCVYENESDFSNDNNSAATTTGVIYFNQRGAGCGKTYESIQLLKVSKYLESKSIFIYLTKMKSATCVIYNELISQIQTGKLGNDVEQIEDKACGNQRKVVLKISGVERTVYIGTIDSFAWAIRDQTREYYGQTMFQCIVQDIGNGLVSSNTNCGYVQYARARLKLTNKYMFVIDEAQDLVKDYLSAVLTIIDKTGIDAYVIGDKLQSVSNENNLFTHVEGMSADTGRVIKNSARNENVVKRFHRSEFVNFVNAIVPFLKYELPEITGICDGKKCAYLHDEQSSTSTPAIQIEWKFPNCYDFKIEEANSHLKKISDMMRTLIKTHGYLPFNFCFIFPIVNDKNQMLSILEPYIQNFWIDFFSDSNVYANNALLIENMEKKDAETKSDYWATKRKLREKDTNYYKYIHWHRSEGNQTIDLSESDHASRILSIHSSKGTGCECVFFLGVSQKTLTYFTGGVKDTLVYDSLLHVGLTRQKQYIYVGIDYRETQQKNDIFRRFERFKPPPKNCKSGDDDGVEPDISYISKYSSLAKISDEILEKQALRTSTNESPSNEDDMLLNNIIDEDSTFLRYSREIGERKEKTETIDWGHHVIRHAVLRVSIHKYLLSDCIDQKHQQLWAMHMTLITNAKNIKYKRYKEYNNLRFELKNRIRSNVEGIDRKELSIPILVFQSGVQGTNDYDEFREAIKSYVNSVIEKIKNNNMKLCPIESIVYCHLLDMSCHPFELSVSMIQIYNILHYYREFYKLSSNFDPDHHKKTYHCVCDRLFYKKTSASSSHILVNEQLNNSITNHYNALLKVENSMNQYDDRIKMLTQGQPIMYNVDPRFSLGSDIQIADSTLHWKGETNDKKTIILGLSCPQLNSMNIYSVLSKLFFVYFVFMLKLTTKTNDDVPSAAPQVICCIVHLDSEAPLYVDLEKIFADEKKMLVVKNELKTCLLNKYKTCHYAIFDFFNYHRNKNRLQTDSEWIHIFDKLNELIADKQPPTKKYKTLPSYISLWFKSIDEVLKTSGNKDRKKQIRCEMKDNARFQRWMIDELNKKLEYEINTMLKFKPNQSDDNSDLDSSDNDDGGLPLPLLPKV
jgi:Competence protein CoiA-like family